MKNIIDYITLEGENSSILDGVVNEHIRHGWQPWGTQFYTDHGHPCQKQAMVKYGTVRHKTIRKTEVTE